MEKKPTCLSFPIQYPSNKNRELNHDFALALIESHRNDNVSPHALLQHLELVRAGPEDPSLIVICIGGHRHIAY